MSFALLLLLLNSAIAAPSEPISVESLVERAKACMPGAVFHGETVEQDLFEIRVTLVTCDEAYFWYEGVCGHTEERWTSVFSRTDGRLLSGPCYPEG